MKSLSETLNKMEPSCTVAINAKAIELRQNGIDVINLSAGQPDFPTPENVKEAGIKAIRENKTNYTPSSGIIELKTAVVEKLKRDRVKTIYDDGNKKVLEDIYGHRWKVKVGKDYYYSEPIR